MKKNKFTFLAIASCLALSALVGCGDKAKTSSTPQKSSNSINQPSSNISSSSETISSSNTQSSSSSKASSSSNKSSSSSISSSSSKASSSSLNSSSSQASSSSQPGTWEYALAVLHREVSDKLGDIDLYYEDVTYTVEPNGSDCRLSIRYMDTAMNSSLIRSFVSNALLNAGYRPFGSGYYWNYHVMVDCVYVGQYGAIYEFRAYSADCVGYGIYDLSGGTTEAEKTNDTPGYDAQYLIRFFDFCENQRFVFINYDLSQEFLVSFENAGEYIEYDSENNYYVAKRDFTAHVYIKIKAGNNSVHLDYVD